ncbi:MAG: M1 family metallopeptidase [Candidatus Krumholzibacteriia bacterium]
MKLQTAARRLGGALSMATLFLGAAPAAARAAPAPLVVHHHARVTLDPARNGLAVVDTVTFDGATPDSFTLNARLVLPGGPPDGAAGGADSATVVRPLARLRAPDPDDPVPRHIARAAGTFLESTQDVVFTRENVGREIRATVGNEGIYLAGEACWLPTFGQALVTSRLTIDTPAGIEPMTNGVRVVHETRGDRLITVWVERNPVDGIALIAGRYTVTEAQAGPVAISTWLLQDDPKLAALYLERTRVYLDMYDRMIGPYPFGKFATVENWFPTGYGMPSWTLLGGAVMRLPFIPYTSFGHEVAHNWWGNSVFVADAGGNWCEGLTTYCADYHYKELESPAAAREYRRNLLKDYAAYLRDPAKDIPLTQFRERHSGATRAIGYGKAMMVFHMVDRLIGRERFEQALRDVYAAKKFQKASWDDFFAAFGRAGGLDLSDFARQWLTRTGAPVLTLDKAARQGDKVRFTLSQGAPPYTLDVPVVVTTATGSVESSVRLDRMSGDFEVAAPGARSLAIDPDCHLFRRLGPREIEPTISQVLGEETPLIVLPDAAGPELAAAEAFARAYTESETPMTVGGGLPPNDIRPGAGVMKVLVNPRPEALAERTAGPLKGLLTIAGDLVFLAGQRYDLKQNDLVFATYDPRDAAVTDLVVLCRSPERLPGLAGRVGHYGKYSYLVFPAGRGDAVKGNWPVTNGPLTATLAPAP